MKICYFVNQYPKVSHTFIRREILALESLGAEVVRISARNNPNEIVDPTDKQELAITECIASQKKIRLITHTIITCLLSPLRFFRALMQSLSLAFYDNNRYVKNIIYLLEACVLLRLCQQHNVEHVHAHFATNSTSVVMLCHLLGGPKYSFTVHGPEEFDKPIQISLGEKIRYSDFVVAITSYCRSQLYRWCDFKDWPKIQEVHCTVDKELTEKPAVPIQTSNAFISIGRLCEQKGQMLMLRAAALLKQEDVDFSIALIGDGELREEIERFIEQENLNNNIQLLGWQSTAQIIETFDRSSVLLLPSFAEGLPVVIMESYARSKPVLSTYIAGIPELVADDSGWLVPAGDIQALAQTMKKIITTPVGDLQELGECGHQKILERHDSLKEAEKLLKYMSKGY